MAVDEQNFSIAKIELNKRTVTERPDEFDKSTSTLKPITSEFEKWLIIATDTIKRELSSYFENTSGEESDRTKVKNELATKFSISRIAKYNSDFQFFDTLVQESKDQIDNVRAVRISETTPITSTSVEKMITDIQLFTLEAEHKRANSKFLMELANFITNIETINTISATSIQQFRSWPNVLQDYLQQEDPEF